MLVSMWEFLVQLTLTLTRCFKTCEMQFILKSYCIHGDVARLCLCLCGGTSPTASVGGVEDWFHAPGTFQFVCVCMCVRLCVSAIRYFALIWFGTSSLTANIDSVHPRRHCVCMRCIIPLCSVCVPLVLTNGQCPLTLIAVVIQFSVSPFCNPTWLFLTPVGWAVAYLHITLKERKCVSPFHQYRQTTYISTNLNSKQAKSTAPKLIIMGK